MRVVKLAAGMAVGYVLGSRAGREKYEQIVATARKVSGRSDEVPPTSIAPVTAEPADVDTEPG